MIRYALSCAKGHDFEAWFRSGTACEEQETNGDITCPVCGGNDVKRALMAPSIRHAAAPRPAGETSSPDVSSPAPHQVGAGLAKDAELKQLHAAVRELHERVKASAEYVGPRFAEEARRIHFEEAPDRGIYGEASAQDVKSLAEDGIEVWPLPHLPEDLS